MTLLMADLNDKVGSVKGRYHGQTETWQHIYENDEMLADVCAFNNVIIGGSVFLHRRKKIKSTISA